MFDRKDMTIPHLGQSGFPVEDITEEINISQYCVRTLTVRISYAVVGIA